MADFPQSGGAPQGANRGTKYNAKHAQLQERASRYKKRIAIAAIAGFGCVSFLIANPELGQNALAALNNGETNASQQNDDSSSNSFFNQQGGNSNNGASQQSPFTRSGGS